MPGPGGGSPNLGPQFIPIPFVSQGWAVGLLFALHVLVVAFIMGTAWILVFTGGMPLTVANARFERFTHTFARTLEITYSFGATLAVFALAVLFGLFPRYISVLTTVLGLPLAVIFAAWITMILSLLVYYFSWARLRPGHRRAHQGLIVLYAVAETVFIVMITLFTAYQITPPRTPTLVAALANPTWFPEALHRVVGNLSYSGYLIAAWAAWRYWARRRTGTSVDKAFYHWTAHLGLLWGLGWELAQVPIGTYYVFAIKVAGPRTYAKMMLRGDTAREWLLQILLVSIMFVLGEVYVWSSIRHAADLRRGRRVPRRARQLAPVGQRTPLTARQGDLARQDEQTAELGAALPRDERAARGVDRFAETWARVGIWVLVAAGVLAVIPDAVPVIGTMAAKWVALGVFVGWTAINLVLYVVVSRRWTWGSMPRPAMWSLMAGGMAITLLMVSMGVIRYTDPQTATIERQLPAPAITVQSLVVPPGR
jgi:hypothetical protein